MWIRPSVCRNSLERSDRAGRSFSLFSKARYIASSLILALTLFLLPATVTAEQLICNIILNQEDKGDLFIDRLGDGNFLVKIEDLKNIGFRSPIGTPVLRDGDEYLPLSSMAGVTFTFDESLLSLAITANPSLLGKEIVDFFPKQTQKVYYPQDSSVFLNYGADYLSGSSFSFSSFNLTNQLGARKGNILFLTDSVYSKDQNQERFTRLQSSLTYDDRTELRRIIAGDFFASSGNLGSSLNLGGISLAKTYSIDPYLINYPTLGLAGQVALPSEAKVYLNGMLMKTERFSPGEFELKNITPSGAAGAIDVVLKDPFGREQRISYPFYFSGASLLKRGLHEYSYNLGFLRVQYGTDSYRYGDLAFSAFHRYGISDHFTLGFRAEAGKDLYNLGPQATFLPGNAGLFNLSLAGSTGRSTNTGGAGIASYAYQGVYAGANVSLAGFTKDYTNLAATPSSNRPKTQLSAGVTYTYKLLGSLSVGYTSTRMYVGQERDVASVSYTRNLTSECSITSTYQNIKEANSDNVFQITLNYSPKPDRFVSAGYQATKDTMNSVLELRKNLPIGEGFGYRVALNQSEVSGQETTAVNPSLQYNGRYGIYQGEFNGQQNTGHFSEQYHLSAAGALVYVGGSFGAMRPVYDSFGLVKVGDLKGVKVLLNSQEVGATDSSGKLFIPNLGSFYQSQVAIDTSQVPIEYFLSNVVKVVSPPLRSGSCIPFIAKKLQPITGILAMRTQGEIKPVEFQEVTLTVSGKEILFPTGSGGAFDIDLSQSEEFKKLTEAEESGCGSLIAGSTLFIKPGIYQGTVTLMGRPQSFSLTIPDLPGPIIDLGQIVIDASRETEKAPAMKVAPGPVKNEDKGPTFLAASAKASASVQSVPEVGTIAVTQPAESASVKTMLPSQMAPAGSLAVMEVFFRFDTADLATSDDQAALMTVSRLTKLIPDSRVVINGYTDQFGSQRYNLLLSKKRALTIAAGLKKLGVAEDKIQNVSWSGKRYPTCFNLDESCRKHNRRVLIQIVAGS